MFATLLVISFMIALLWSRLAWIQLVDTRHFSDQGIDLVRQAVKQRQQSLVLDTGRGDILDREGRPLTGKKTQALIIFPVVRHEDRTDELQKVARQLQIPVDELIRFVKHLKQPAVYRNRRGEIVRLTPMEAEAVQEMNIPGILTFPVKERYPSDMMAAQVIGYISQNPEAIRTRYREEWEDGILHLDSLIGGSGLERSFQSFLHGVGPTTVSYFVDAYGNPLKGLDVRLYQPENQFYPLSLVTTLDLELQRELEQLADRQGLHKGSVVVLDVESREVLAMVSRPGFDPNQVDLEQGGWRNRALEQIAPGSVFKTVIAAAALEEGVAKPLDRFYCDGEWGKYGFSCWKKGGHGELTFAEAYAQSCNITFARVALELGDEKIREYAGKIGVTLPNGWQKAPFFKMEAFAQFDAEDVGQVFAPSTPSDDEGVLIQTAIGQRDVRMTPLQAANMAATIAEEGRSEQVRIVNEIRYKTGVPFYTFESRSLSTDSIERYTAYQLQRMMRMVVTEGTGSDLQDAGWQVAGKSGTAEVTDSPTSRVNQWFVGYAPADRPRYAIAVVAENQPSYGNNQAVEMFRQVIQILRNTYGS
ncbi:MAG: penicillin-binding protein 2 [Bacillaceae bacterium]|nr:penicillin-binding protein 2 [Bacillaceae bacterium]